MQSSVSYLMKEHSTLLDLGTKQILQTKLEPLPSLTQDFTMC